MCGFTGYMLKNCVEKNSQAILKMLELQKHRGPDDSGVLGINIKNGIFEELDVTKTRLFENNPSLIFGFNRLSILDLTPAGHQPMINDSNRVALMMNGEVYNAFEYKQELIDKGYLFKGNSDTEVVLNLYLAYGVDGMLARLNGMFALAIYDGRIEQLLLIRDRMGIKPLYLLQEPNRISFSSEIKSFKALPGFQFRLDETQLSEFLVFRNTINNTLFQNIINVTPGTYWRITNTGEASCQTYYDIRKEGIEVQTSMTKEDLKSTLRNSVKNQMISDVKLGCQLSGGVDSSLVTAYASEFLGRGGLETVSIIFEESDFSEKKYIDQVVKKYDLQAHQFFLNNSSYLSLIDEAVWHFEHPLNHPNTIGIKLLSREAKKYVTVLLSGEGADEAFAGYKRFFPSSTSLFSLNTLKKLVINRFYFTKFIKIWKKEKYRYLLQTAFGNLADVAAIYPKFSSMEALRSREMIWDSINDSLGRKKRKYELLSYLPDLLMRQDKMSMAHAIENRVPFLDNEMIKVAMQIDESLLIKKYKKGWIGKSLLKSICAETFDEAFANRSKMGFSIPLRSFFSSSLFLNRWEQELLPGIKKRGIFNTKPLIKWMRNPENMTAEQIDSIWLMVGFEIWSKQYLD